MVTLWINQSFSVIIFRSSFHLAVLDGPSGRLVDVVVNQHKHIRSSMIHAASNVTIALLIYWQMRLKIRFTFYHRECHERKKCVKNFHLFILFIILFFTNFYSAQVKVELYTLHSCSYIQQQYNIIFYKLQIYGSVKNKQVHDYPM